MSLINTMECKTCENELEYEMSLDDENDLWVFVESCPECMQNMYQAGIEEGQRRKAKKTPKLVEPRVITEGETMEGRDA